MNETRRWAGFESADALRAAYAAVLGVIADIQESDVLEETGYSRVSMLVADLARVGPRRVSRWLRHAEAITEVVTPTGHVAPARLPVVREAVLGGGLDEDQVDAIVRAITKIPTWASGDTVGVVERHLVDVAMGAPASTVAKHGKRGAVSPGRNRVDAPVGDRRTRNGRRTRRDAGSSRDAGRVCRPADQ